jgi:hypothetical protein
MQEYCYLRIFSNHAAFEKTAKYRRFYMKKYVFLFVTLLCSVTFAQNPAGAAVYVTGDIPDNEKKVLGMSIHSSLNTNSGRDISSELSNALLAEIELAKQGGGIINDSLICQLAGQLGIKYVCVADVTPAFGLYHISARIVKVENVAVASTGKSSGPLKTADDITELSDNLVKSLRDWQVKPESVANVQAIYPPPAQSPRTREPAQATPPQPEMAASPASTPVSPAAEVLTAAATVADAVLFKPKTITLQSPDPNAILTALKDTRPGDTIAVTIPIPAQMGMAAKMLKPKSIVAPLHGTTAKEIGSTIMSAKPKPGDTIKLVIPTLSDIAEEISSAGPAEESEVTSQAKYQLKPTGRRSAVGSSAADENAPKPKNPKGIGIMMVITLGTILLFGGLMIAAAE